MKIALLSDSKTGINIFPKLSEKLLEKIADAEVSQHFVHTPKDIPLSAKKLASSSGLVFVFLLLLFLAFPFVPGEPLSFVSVLS